MAGLSIGGSKSKNKSKEQTNQVQTNVLSDRAVGQLNQGIADAGAMDYQRFDPSTIGQYESPYTSQVIDASLAQADQQDAIARNEQMSEFGKASAFGDKRRGVYEAQLAGDQSRGRASLIAGLRDNSYGQARAIAQGENQNANQMELALQALIAQLRGGFANEGTQTLNGTTTGKSTGTNIGFSWAGK